MIEEAAEQMTGLLDELGTAARIQAGRWEPGLREADTLELARPTTSASTPSATATTVETEADVVARSLQALAVAAVRHGPVDTRDLDGATAARSSSRRSPRLPRPSSPASELRDLGSLVARYVLEELGGSLELDGETLRVRL